MFTSHLAELKYLFSRYASQRMWGLAFLTILTVFTVASQLSAPVFLQQTIDAALSSRDDWRQNAYLFFTVTFFGLFIQVIFNTQSARLALEVTNALRKDLLYHVVGLGATYRDNTKVGDTIEVIDGQVTAIQNILSSLLGQSIVQILLVIGVLGVAFSTHPWAGIGFLSYIIITLILVRNPPAVSSGLVQRSGEAHIASSAALYSLLKARSNLTANRGEVFALRGFAGVRSDFVSAHRAAIKSSLLWTGRASTLLSTSAAFSLALGGWLYLQNTVSLGTILMLVQLATILIMPLLLLSGNYDEIAFSVAALEPIRKLRLSESDLHEPVSPESLIDVAPEVVVRDLTFSYGEKQVLKAVGFCAPANSLVGIVGATGSGKSTLGQLLTRIRDPQLGGIFFDGINIKSVAAADRFRFVYLADQDQTQLHGSLEHNLTLYGPIEPLKLQKAISLLVQLHPNFGEWHEQGILTTLSDGELQLIALARAMVSEARVVVLDEVNARLDPQMRQNVLTIISRMTEEKTVFLIAHRPESLNICSHVLILQNGTVKDFGSREAVTASLTNAREVWQ